MEIVLLLLKILGNQTLAITLAPLKLSQLPTYSRYKWKVVSCNIVAEIMCSLRIPNCPAGFEWVQSFDSSSCFFAPLDQEVSLVKTIGATVYNYYSFWTFEQECSKFGARQANVHNDSERHQLEQWLQPKLQTQYTDVFLGMKVVYHSSPGSTFAHTNL